MFVEGGACAMAQWHNGQSKPGRLDEVDQVGWCVAVQTTMNNRTQLVFDALLNRKPVAIAQNTLSFKNSKGDRKSTSI